MDNIQTGQTKRADHPLYMVLAYQEQTAAVVRILDKLKNEKAFDIKQIFNVIWPEILRIVPDLAGSMIIGLRDKKITCHVEKRESDIKKWSDLDQMSKNKIHEVLEKQDTSSVVFRNYEKDAPLVSKSSPEEQALAISWLCVLPDDEELFWIAVRDIESKPFLSHEIQAIKIISRIFGSHLSYVSSFQNLLYSIYTEQLITDANQ